MSRTPQQSKNWDKYINEIPFKFRIKLLNKTKYCEEGFPRYIYSDKGMIRFTLILRNGEIIENAILDTSRQYMSEGSQWRSKHGEIFDKYQVLAWKKQYIVKKEINNMLLIKKLKEHLERKLDMLEIQTNEPSTCSYTFGRIKEIKYILKWIDNLSNKDEINDIIKKIEESNSQNCYSYMGFNYEDLLKLREIL